MFLTISGSFPFSTADNPLPLVSVNFVAQGQGYLSMVEPLCSILSEVVLYFDTGITNNALLRLKHSVANPNYPVGGHLFYMLSQSSLSIRSLSQCVKSFGYPLKVEARVMHEWRPMLARSNISSLSHLAALDHDNYDTLQVRLCIFAYCKGLF